MAEMCAVWRTTRHRHVQSQRDKTRYASGKGRSDHSGEGGSGRRGFAVITRNPRQNNRTKQEPGATADSTCVGRRSSGAHAPQTPAGWWQSAHVCSTRHIRKAASQDAGRGGRQDFHLRRKRNDKSNEVPPGGTLATESVRQERSPGGGSRGALHLR